MKEFQINDDKIIQGDALDILKTIPDESIDLIFINPPYNIGKNLVDSKINGHQIRNI